VTVRHFDIDTGRPYDDYRAAYETAVPHFDRLEAIGVTLSGAGWTAIQGLSDATTPAFVLHNTAADGVPAGAPAPGAAERDHRPERAAVPGRSCSATGLARAKYNFCRLLAGADGRRVHLPPVWRGVTTHDLLYDDASKRRVFDHPGLRNGGLAGSCLRDEGTRRQDTRYR
jgi:hypothetical protein